MIASIPVLLSVFAAAQAQDPAQDAIASVLQTNSELQSLLQDYRTATESAAEASLYTAVLAFAESITSGGSSYLKQGDPVVATEAGNDGASDPTSVETITASGPSATEEASVEAASAIPSLSGFVSDSESPSASIEETTASQNDGSASATGEPQGILTADSGNTTSVASENETGTFVVGIVSSTPTAAASSTESGGDGSDSVSTSTELSTIGTIHLPAETSSSNGTGAGSSSVQGGAGEGVGSASTSPAAGTSSSPSAVIPGAGANGTDSGSGSHTSGSNSGSGAAGAPAGGPNGTAGSDSSTTGAAGAGIGAGPGANPSASPSTGSGSAGSNGTGSGPGTGGNPGGAGPGSGDGNGTAGGSGAPQNCDGGSCPGTDSPVSVPGSSPVSIPGSGPSSDSGVPLMSNGARSLQPALISLGLIAWGAVYLLV